MSSECHLSSEQAHSLFDILTSHTTLTEIESLKLSKNIATFGPPLQPFYKDATSSPLIRILLQSFVLDLPGLRDVTPHFWTDSVYKLATALDDANLSESYDKGSVGIRRTLSTATASIVESVARGRLGGYPRQAPKQDATYDRANPDDIIRAWDDFLQRIIYGDLLDKMFVKAAQTDKLADHESVVQAAHQYALIILASLLHHNLIVSPRGQSMISLLNRVHRLAPYFLIKQTLRVGNAATMLNGMVQLLLAKMNLSTVTSWFGGQVSDNGMNLLQQIISQVLSAEINELRKRAKTIEQLHDSPRKSQLDSLRKYISKTAEEQKRLRASSRSQSRSIASVVLEESTSPPALSDSSHKLALEFLSIQLAIRDREKLIEVLCHHQPDLMTTSIRELVKVYDPIIRALHNAVDLAAGVTDAQNFLDDLINLSLLDKNKAAKLPTVQDFVHLLQKHQGSSHVFIHQGLKNGKELSQWYREYASHAIEQYKSQNSNNNRSTPDGTAAGDFTPRLNNLIATLSEDERRVVYSELDRHTTFLNNLAQRSKSQMDKIVRSSLAPTSGKSNNNSKEDGGNPGMFLYKWQHYIDSTIITPGPQNGAPRKGKSDSVKEATAVDVEGRRTYLEQSSKNNDDLEPPDVSNVVRLLGPGFRAELQKLVDVRKGGGS
ncbi:MAG: hypothetical protein Q9225_001509 [Loekoesia sp. 1 TL-2023]